MKNRYIISSFIFLVAISLKAQPESPLDFTFKYYFENFANKKEYWINSEDSMIVLDLKNNRLKIENRKNENDYVKFSTKKNYNTIYQISIEFVLLPALNITNSAGLLFNFSDTDTSFLVVEINGKEQYRIRKKIKGNDSHYTSGFAKEGWVSHSAIHKTSEKNKISLNVFVRKYYLYINDQFVQSFEDKELHHPRLGLITGPLSTVMYHNLSVSLPEEVVISDQEEEPENPDFATLSTDSVNSFDYKATAQDEQRLTKILELGSEIYLLQTSINRSLDMIDSLKQENKRLTKLNPGTNSDTDNKSKENVMSQQIEILNEQLNLATEMIQRLLGLQGKEE